MGILSKEGIANGGPFNGEEVWHWKGSSSFVQGTPDGKNHKYVWNNGTKQFDYVGVVD